MKKLWADENVKNAFAAQEKALKDYIRSSKLALDYMDMMTLKYGEFRDGMTWAPATFDGLTYPNILWTNSSLVYNYNPGVATPSYGYYSMTAIGQLVIPYTCSFTVSFPGNVPAEMCVAIGTASGSTAAMGSVTLGANIFPNGCYGSALFPHRKGVFGEVNGSGTTIVPGMSLPYAINDASQILSFRELVKGAIEFGVNGNYVMMPKLNTFTNFMGTTNRVIAICTQSGSICQFNLTMVVSP